MGSTRPVELGSICTKLSSSTGLGVAAAAVVVVVVASASTVVGATVVGGPVAACVLATVILKGYVAGGSAGLEVIFVGPGNKIYFSVLFSCTFKPVFLIIREPFSPCFLSGPYEGNMNPLCSNAN